MKKLICLFLAILFLLCGCQAAVQQTPTQTDPIPTVIEHYFYSEPCDCWASPSSRYSEDPNFTIKTGNYSEAITELKGKTVTLCGIELTYEYSAVHTVSEHANKPAKEIVLYDIYRKPFTLAFYFHGTDILRYLYVDRTVVDKTASEKTMSELQSLAEAFMRDSVSENYLSEYKYIDFTKSSSDESSYTLRYVREFPETQNEDVISVQIDIWGNILTFEGPRIDLLDFYSGKIKITNEMKEAAITAAKEFMERHNLMNVEITETRYHYNPCGIMYLDITFECDLTIPDKYRVPGGPETTRHEETWVVNVN